jgi:flagellar protein FlaF
MSLKTYQNTQKVTEKPRETEYRLFGQVTRSLIDVSGMEIVNPDFHTALHWNRELWTALSTDCAIEGNQLPDTLRGQIISLAIWVGKYTSDVAHGDGDIQDLIDINRIIMEGLAMNNNNSSKESIVNASGGGQSIKI